MYVELAFISVIKRTTVEKKNTVLPDGETQKRSIKSMLIRTSLPTRYSAKNVRVGLDGKKHRRNLNTMIVGGSGAGKTRFYGKPNIMQCNTSFVVLDPKGEILRDVGHLLEREVM